MTKKTKSCKNKTDNTNENNPAADTNNNGTTKTQITIFLADVCSIQCRLVGIINIPIYKSKKIIGTLRSDDVLIVPNLDRRIFLTNSFLYRGNDWVHFDKHNIQLDIQNGSTIKIPIASL